MKMEQKHPSLGIEFWPGSMKLTSLIKGLTMLLALVIIALGVACSGQAEQVVAASDEDRIIKIETVRSIVDPVPGHENHQLAILIPPDTKNVWRN